MRHRAKFNGLMAAAALGSTALLFGACSGPGNGGAVVSAGSGSGTATQGAGTAAGSAGATAGTSGTAGGASNGASSAGTSAGYTAGGSASAAKGSSASGASGASVGGGISGAVSGAAKTVGGVAAAATHNPAGAVQTGVGSLPAPLPTGGNGGATDTGVTANSIAIGDVEMYGMALANVLVTPQANGDHAAFNAINDAGGVYGRRFVLYDCDDGFGDQASSDACITKLVTQNHIFALTTGVDWGSAGNGPTLAQYKLPYIGSWGYSNSEWLDPLDFPTHMSMLHEAAANGLWDATVIKPKTYGLICLNAPEMQIACSNVKKVLAPTGAKLVKQVNVDISAADLSSQVLAMKLANPDVIVHYVINPATMVKFMVDAAEQGYYPPKGINGNHLAAEALGSLFGQWPAGRYWTNTTYKLWGNGFMSTMAKYAPGNHGIEHHIVQAGYVAANEIAAAAKKAGPQLTRTKIEQVLFAGSWAADPDLGQYFIYSTAGLPERGAIAGSGQCHEYIYKMTSTNTVSSTGNPVGFAPDPNLFEIHDPMAADCTQ